MSENSERVGSILSLFRNHGHKSYGENVTELEHALQCATFAQDNGEDESVVVACLLHDIGHLCHDLGEDIADQGTDAQHEDIGAKLLQAWFPPKIVEPIRLHVAAKRYLCWKDQAYRDNLSDASRQSLEIQGGAMSDDEARAFEGTPHYEAALRVRGYDEMGKVPEMKTPRLEEFVDAITRQMLA